MNIAQYILLNTCKETEEPCIDYYVQTPLPSTEESLHIQVLLPMK